MTARRPNGFTLVELLVYLSMSTIVILVISQFMVDVSRNAARNRASLELQANSRFLVSRMSQNIRTSASLAVTSPSDLSLTLPNGDVYQYALSGSALIESRTSGAAVSTETLTSNTVAVSSLVFSEQEGGVGIALVLESAAVLSPPAPTHALETTIIPRRLLYQ